MDSEILDNLQKQQGLITFPKASDKDIAKLSQNLKSLSCPEIPEDYCAFLKQTDGLIFNDIELYGCNPHKRPDYEFPDIKFVAKLTSDTDFFRKNIIIGLSSEEIIVYNGGNNFYAVADRITLDYLAQYESFAELFKFLTNQ